MKENHQKSKYYPLILSQLEFAAEDIDRQIRLILRDHGDEYVPSTIEIQKVVLIKGAENSTE